MMDNLKASAAFEMMQSLSEVGVQIRISNKVAELGYWWVYLTPTIGDMDISVVKQGRSPMETFWDAAEELNQKIGTYDFENHPVPTLQKIILDRLCLIIQQNQKRNGGDGSGIA